MKMTKAKIGGCSVLVIIGLMLAQYGNEIRTTERGLEIIGNAEGCKREPYYCPAGVLTVGIGSTAAGGEPIIRNKIYSDQEIAGRWKDDIKLAEQCVNKFGAGAALPLSTFEATTSIVFNVGCSKMRYSTMFKYLRAGQYSLACNEFSKWVYSGGKKLRGLEIRRDKEKALCLMDLVKS
ncbi:glycoside hydrolase [Pasteurellaceae bacterium 15-036681]|nr:glycoside hydrolase [Pasteurellaceae bacterium 15-036681]